MAASFGGVSSSASSFLGTRQTGNLLTKASWWCGGLFLGLSFMLALASTRSRAPKSVLDQTVRRRLRRAPAREFGPGAWRQPDHGGSRSRAGNAGAHGTAPAATPPATGRTTPPATTPPATKKP